MRALTQRMLAQSGYEREVNPVIASLADFAAQRSGIDTRDYFSDWRDHEGRKAYQSEVKDISDDLRRFREALNVAASEGVTDADVIEAARDRLTWQTRYTCEKCGKSGRSPETAKNEAPHDWRMFSAWHYVTGQYFCTEYRKAAASVLESATRAVRQRRPPERQRVTTINQLKALNERNGGCWFERDTMRFFGTRIETGITRGRYFITSEQPPHGPREYTVRSFNETGDVNTVGEFCGYSSKSEALKAIEAEFTRKTGGDEYVETVMQNAEKGGLI